MVDQNHNEYQGFRDILYCNILWKIVQCWYCMYGRDLYCTWFAANPQSDLVTTNTALIHIYIYIYIYNIQSVSKDSGCGLFFIEYMRNII